MPPPLERFEPKETSKEVQVAVPNGFYQNRIVQFLLSGKEELFRDPTGTSGQISPNQRHQLVKMIADGSLETQIQDMLATKMADLSTMTSSEMRDICRTQVELLRKEGHENIVHDRFVDAAQKIHETLAVLTEPQQQSDITTRVGTELADRNDTIVDQKEAIYDLLEQTNNIDDASKARLMVLSVELLRKATRSTNVGNELQRFFSGINGLDPQVAAKLVASIGGIIEKKTQLRAPSATKTLADQPETKLTTSEDSNELAAYARENDMNMLEIPGPRLNHVLIPRKVNRPQEPTVRIYRGINNLDDQSLKAVPYAMRSSNEQTNTRTLETIRHEVELLANEPTYEHLLDYVQKAAPLLAAPERVRLQQELAKIEQQILSGVALRRALIHEQTLHLGTVADSGVSPYVSASFSLDEARSYVRDRGALVIMDIPLSFIEDFNHTSSETNIKGALDKKFITAVIPGTKEDLQDTAALKRSLDAIEAATQVVPLNATSEAALRNEQLQSTQQNDEKQLTIDIAAVQQKRALGLAKSFSELNLDLANLKAQAASNGTDIYTATKRAIFDHYATAFTALGRAHSDVAEYEYTDTTGAKRNFDNSQITDHMLKALRNFVDHQQDMKLQRAA